MDDIEIYEKITPVFQEVFDDDDLVPHAKMTASDVAEWDSLNHIRLICSVEALFGIRFSTSEVMQFQNVGDFVASIKPKTAKVA